MKMLIAINSVNPKLISDRALRWCGRMGADVRLFVPKTKRSKFTYAVDDANYHYYLALDPNETVVSRTDALSYARQHGYGLLLTVPEELESWRKGMAFHDNEIKQAYETVDKARAEFTRKPRKRVRRFANGAVMERIV